MESKIEYYSKEMIEVLKANMPSAATMHRLMNPMCAECLIERYVIDNGDGTISPRVSPKFSSTSEHE